MISSQLRHLRLLLLFLLPLFMAATSVAAAQSNPALMRGDALSITVGELVEVPILLENAYEVYAIDVQMRFDPAQLEVVDSNANSAGVQVLPGSFPNPEFQGQNSVVNADGTIHYLITQINPTPPASGSGTVFTVLLRAKTNGDSLLRFELVEMSSRDGLLLDVTTQDVALSATGGAPGVTPGAALVVPTIPAAGGGNDTAAATATAVPPTASPVNSSAAPTIVPAAGSTTTGSMATVASLPATAVAATIAPAASGSDIQAPAVREQQAASVAQGTGTGAVAAVERGTGTLMPAAADGVALIAVGEAVTQANEEAVARAVIGSEANSAETAVPSAAENDDVPGGSDRTTLLLMLALLILAAGSIGLLVLLIRNRTPSP